MSKTDPALPAPLSLTLEDASKVAAGAHTTIGLTVAPWWWFGQPAYFNVASQFNPAVNVAAGQIAGR